MKQTAIVVIAAAVLLPLPLAAQDAAQDRAALAALRACARIADVTARVACYDSNVGVEIAQPGPAAGSATFGANQLPAPRPAASTPPPQPPQEARGFGANQLPRDSRASEGPNALTVTLAAVSQAEPGIYLLTLPDGAQWRFVDAAPLSYDPPRKGSSVEFLAAALGSYLLRYNGQMGLRIRRVR